MQYLHAGAHYQRPQAACQLSSPGNFCSSSSGFFSPCGQTIHSSST